MGGRNAKKARSGFNMPIQYKNPNDKCWFNAIMVILTIFRPFQELLAATDKPGPVAQAFIHHFKNPTLSRRDGNIIDTIKFMRDLRTAVSDHLKLFPESEYGTALHHMLNESGHHDPGEVWNLIHGVLRDEQGIDRNNSHIGVCVKHYLTCNCCHHSRLQTNEDDNYLFQAVQLNALTLDKEPSVQAAIQFFFSPEDEVQVRCCKQAQNTPHVKSLECEEGDAGMVFYGPFNQQELKLFDNTDFCLDEEIRLPFQGPSSGIQSVYRLMGFTACCSHRQHHMAVIYDNKGQPWTYNDARLTEGLPQEKWVPGLLFYERWEQQTQENNITFLAVHAKAPKSRSPGSTSSSSASDCDDRPQQGGSISKSGRFVQPTQFYRPPPQKKPLPPKAIQEGASTHTQPKPAAPQQTTRARTEKQSSASRVEEQDSSGAPQNELAEKFPPQTWAWVRKNSSYLVATIKRVHSDSSWWIEWAHDSHEQIVNNSRILRRLELREERIVLGSELRFQEGRSLTLAKVEDLLKSKCPVRTSAPLQQPGDNESMDECEGLIFTEATSNWDSVAFPWLLKQDTSFDPRLLAGRPFPFPSKVLDDCLLSNQDFTAHPSAANCAKETCLIVKQLSQDSRLHQLLVAWIHLLPIILLRADESCSPKALSTLVSRRCNQFLHGEWELLFTQALSDAAKLSLRTDRQRVPGNSARLAHIKLQRANKCIRQGNLSKGARILSEEGVSMDPNAHAELLAKHPQQAQVASFPVGYVAPPISELKESEFEKLTSVANLARVAGSFPAESHPDQWGWRPREYIAPLLHDPGVGELIADILIRPRYEGLLPQRYAECYRGGLLIALSKAPKPGVRPIAIGDAFRRIADKALQPFSKKDLAHMFEHEYPNAKQFSSGSADGAEKFIVNTLLALQEDPAPDAPSQTLESDPRGMLLLDQINAFNAFERQVAVDMTTRQYDRSYAQGRLTKDNTTILPESFAVHIPSFQAHYEGDGRLVFNDHEKKLHEITSRTGSQQGCVLGGKLFNIATFSIVGTTMADHPEVFCSSFSDNIALVGRLSQIFKAAEDLRGSLREINLELQPADSAIYIPSYIMQEEPPELLARLKEQYDAFSDLPWKRDGITLLGCPVGTDNFVQHSLQKVCDAISTRAEHFSNVDDGLIHLQLHKFSVNAMLPYFLRTTKPTLSVPYAKQIDALIWKAVLDFSDVAPQDRDNDSMLSVFEDARRQFALPISEGGFGITPNECVAVPAFYSAVSHALRFAASCGFAGIMDYVASPAFRANPLCVTYAQAREDLLSWGAKEPELLDSGSASQPSSAQSASGKQPKSVILPTITDICAHNGTSELHFPDQKVLTRLAQKAHTHWAAQGLSEGGLVRTQHLSKQKIQAEGTEGDTAVYLQRIGKFESEQVLYHSPLAFLAHTSSLEERYPRDLFAVLLSYLLGLPASSCLQRRDVDRCEGCGCPMDKFGHHRMTCKVTSAYHAAHTQLAAAFADTARKSGVPYTDKGIPSHLTNNKIGDALCLLSSDCQQLILDYTVVHPRQGTATAPGVWNANALTNAARNKWNRHGRAYATIGYAFAPCVMTTYGRMEANFLRLLYILAKKRAQLVHVHHRPLVSVDNLFGRFFAQSRARIGAAVARGMALRALGSSLLGVSKVFLKHIAPARYRDQSLAAGPHFAAGHTQWRLTLAA